MFYYILSHIILLPIGKTRKIETSWNYDFVFTNLSKDYLYKLSAVTNNIDFCIDYNNKKKSLSNREYCGCFLIQKCIDKFFCIRTD